MESPFKATFEVVDLNMVRKDLNEGYVTMRLLNWKHQDQMLSTISLLGCSTSVALATGPTDEEEDQMLNDGKP